MAVGVVADAQGAHRRALLHSCCNVDGKAPDAALGVDAATEQHGAGVQADAHIEAAAPVLCLHALALAPAFVEQGQPGVHSAFGIVFAHLIGAKHRQQAVASVIEHLAIMRLHDGRKARQCVVHDGVHIFGVQVLAQRG